MGTASNFLFFPLSTDLLNNEYITELYISYSDERDRPADYIRVAFEIYYIYSILTIFKYITLVYQYPVFDLYLSYAKAPAQNPCLPRWH